MLKNNDHDLVDAMAALKFRISSQGEGIPYLIPIPGHGGNHGILKYVSLPEERINSVSESSVPLSSKGVGADITEGLFVGFEINELEQVATPKKFADEGGGATHLRNGYATYDGTNKLWALKKYHRPIFITNTSDLHALITTIRQLDFVSSDATDHNNDQQLKFLKQTLLQVRTELSNNDTEVAKLNLELKTLKMNVRHTRILNNDINQEAILLKLKKRTNIIEQGKNAVRNILQDPITHVTAIQIMNKLLTSNATLLPTHGNLDNLIDVLETNKPSFISHHEHDNRNTAMIKHVQNTSLTRSSETGVTNDDFQGIEQLNAHKLVQQFTHYVVTICSEGGRRMEINLSHESSSSIDSENNINNAKKNHGMKFIDLRDEVARGWGLVEHKFMVQTDYSMPVDENTNVLSHLQHLAVSERLLFGKKPFLIDARDAFKSIDEDNSGQINVSEFSKLFKRFSSTSQTKIVNVFAEVDIDRSGEITFAEFAEDWPRILKFLKSDIARNELPICYLLPKNIVMGDASYGVGSSNSKIGSNVTGADKHIIDLNINVGNINDTAINQRSDYSTSSILGFEMFDQDNNGTISYDEYLTIFRSINSMDMSDNEVRRELKELFHNTNTSKTGNIDYGEFSKNWSNIIKKMADHSRVFSETEILNELGQYLGKNLNEDLEPVSLPMREASMIREAFVYCVLIVLLTICTFENRNILSSHYMIYKFRSSLFDTSLNGNGIIMSTNWNGVSILFLSLPIFSNTCTIC